MDNNNQNIPNNNTTPENPTGTVPVIPNPTPSPAGESTPPPAPVMPTPMSSPNEPVNPTSTPKSNRMLLVIIAIFFVAVILAIIYFISMQKLSQIQQNVAPTPVPTVAIPTPSATPTPTVSVDQLNNTDVGNPQNDLNQIDQNVNQL